LAVSNEIKGLSPAPADFAFFRACASEFPSRCARARRTPRTRKRRRSFTFTTISVFPEENVAAPRRARVRKARRGARSIRAKAAASPKRRRMGPSGFDGSVPTCAIGREAETRRMGASRPPSMGEMRLAWRADSTFLRRATWHNDAPAPFEARSDG
jgi:hypothetical protein